VRGVLTGALLVPLVLGLSGCWLFNVVPVASFTISGQTGQAPFTVNFSAVLSSDEDGVIVRFDWDFGDGTSGTGEAIAHTYDTAGTYTVVLRVTDDGGDSATTQKTIYVTPAEPPGPTASFSASPSSGTSPLTVTFDAGASFYDDGAIGSYEWEFGDGSTWFGRTASHTYFTAGSATYTVTLTVRGTDGKTGTASRQITVTAAGGGATPAPSGAPSARFDIVDDPLLAGGPAGTTGVAPYNALFDPDDTEVALGMALLQIVWSFGDGGSASSTTLATIWHTYVTSDPSEVFDVTLLAMDNAAATDAITKTVKVYNHQPVAGFEVCNPAGGIAGLQGTEVYATEALAIAAAQWDDDDTRPAPNPNTKDDGIVIGDLQQLPAVPWYNVPVWIRSRPAQLPLATSPWYALVDTGLQDTLAMAEGVLAAPGTTKPVPNDYAGDNRAYSYDPEGQYFPGGEPAWFPNAGWGIQWIYVDWGDGSAEEPFDYSVECDNPVGAPLYDDPDGAVMGHVYVITTAPPFSVTYTITVRAVDFLGAEDTYSRTIELRWADEGATNDL